MLYQDLIYLTMFLFMLSIVGENIIEFITEYVLTLSFFDLRLLLIITSMI